MSDKDVIDTKNENYEIGMDHTGAETSIANLRHKLNDIIRDAD